MSLTVSDRLAIAEEWITTAIEQIEAEGSDVEQIEALRRLFRSGRIANAIDAITVHANYACDANEKAEGWS